MPFDGANIWVASGSSVVKLRASDGTSQNTFSVGTQAEGVAFDGTNIWVANFGSNSVTELRARDGTTVGTSNPAVGRGAPKIRGQLSTPVVLRFVLPNTGKVGV